MPIINNNDNIRIESRNSRFFTISSLRRKLSPTRTLNWPGSNLVQITCNSQSAHHVQHVVCHLVRRDSSAIKIGRVKIAFISALFYLLKRSTDEVHCASDPLSLLSTCVIFCPVSDPLSLLSTCVMFYLSLIHSVYCPRVLCSTLSMMH